MVVIDQRLLLISTLLLGLAPFALRLTGGIFHPGVGMLIFGLNVLVCIFGATTRYRLFWIAYGIACVAVLAFFGMSSPLALSVVLAGIKLDA
jgi:hypothetical protein